MASRCFYFFFFGFGAGVSGAGLVGMSLPGFGPPAQKIGR